MKLYSAMYKEVFEKENVNEDKRTSEEIIEDTLNLFKKKGRG